MRHKNVMKKKSVSRLEQKAEIRTGQDTELIFRIKEGDENGLGELVDRYQKRIMSVAYKITGDWHAAQDIAQEVFMTLMEKIDTFDPERSFFSWIYRITVNRSIDYLRKQGREQITFNEKSLYTAVAETSEQLMIKSEMRKKVQKVLGRLPLQYRIALVLRDIESISMLRISEILDLVPATARWRVFQARKLFREIWEKEGEDYEL
ncbi:RNA polymerase sigma factor [Planctomycetota bacterium]